MCYMARSESSPHWSLGHCCYQMLCHIAFDNKCLVFFFYLGAGHFWLMIWLNIGSSTYGRVMIWLSTMGTTCGRQMIWLNTMSITCGQLMIWLDTRSTTCGRLRHLLRFIREDVAVKMVYSTRAVPTHCIIIWNSFTASLGC